MKPITATTLTPSAYGSWVSMDITSNVGTDAGSVGAALLFVKNTDPSNRYAVDVRAVGSSYTSPFQMQLTAGAGQLLVAPTNTSDAFEINAENAALDIELIGYTLSSGVTFLSSPVDVTPTTTGAFTALDLSGQVPAGATYVVLRALATGGVPGAFTTRPTGDTSITGAGYLNTNNYAETIVPITSQACEVYVGSSTTIQVVAYGTETIDYLSSPGTLSASSAGWNLNTLSPSTGYDVAIVQFISDAVADGGIRGGDETADLYGTYNGVLGMPALINASNQISLYDSGGTYHLMGWLQTTSGVNNLPTLDTAIGPQTAVRGTAFSLDVSGHFSDPDGDTLTYTATGLPSSLSISSAGVISGTPVSGDITSGNSTDYSVIVTADDGNGGTVDGSFNLTVRNPQVSGTLVDLSGVPDASVTGIKWAAYTSWPSGTRIGSGTTATTDASGNIVVSLAEASVPSVGTAASLALSLPDGTTAFIPETNAEAPVVS